MNSTLSQFELQNKVVLVTGAAGFLGQHICSALRGAGAKVVAADLVPVEEHEHMLFVVMDVTDEASVVAAFQQAIDAFGQIDVVINNAAIDPKFDESSQHNDRLFENYPIDVLKKSVDVNLIGYTIVAKAAVKHMKENTAGNIINVSSIYGLVGPDQSIYPNGTQKPVEYAITKGGVAMLTKWLATTYGKDGIRSNTVSFGGVLHGHDDTFKKAYGARTPLGRMMNPEEVTGSIIFLASDASQYMTGADLVVDGGWTAW